MKHSKNSRFISVAVVAAVGTCLPLTLQAFTTAPATPPRITALPLDLRGLKASQGSSLPSRNHQSRIISSPHTDQEEEKQKDQKEKEEFMSSGTRQILGLKDAGSTQEKWKIRLQLTKPVSWIPLCLVIFCGAAASGNYHWIWNPWDPNDRDIALGTQDALKGLATCTLSGPFSEGFAQTINDWYDRDIDAINEPYRPIPSGAISQEEVFQQLRFLFLGGLTMAVGLDQFASPNDFPYITAITLMGYFVSYIYSAPPLKLKQNGLTGDLAIGLCYISLPWWCGQAVFGPLDKPIYWILPLLYSLSGVGVAIVNDFKSIEGDLAYGLKSIPILTGIDTAKWLAAFIPDTIQFIVAAFLYSIGEVATAAFVLSMVLPQMYFQSTLLIPDPKKNDLKYMARSQPFLFFGMLGTALSMGNHDWTGPLS